MITDNVVSLCNITKVRTSCKIKTAQVFPIYEMIAYEHTSCNLKFEQFNTCISASLQVYVMYMIIIHSWDKQSEHFGLLKKNVFFIYVYYIVRWRDV